MLVSRRFDLDQDAAGFAGGDGCTGVSFERERGLELVVVAQQLGPGVVQLERRVDVVSARKRDPGGADQGRLGWVFGLAVLGFWEDGEGDRGDTGLTGRAADRQWKRDRVGAAAFRGRNLMAGLVDGRGLGVVAVPRPAWTAA